MDTEKNFYSRQEAAMLLGVSETTITNYVKKGMLINVNGERGALRLTSASLQTMLSVGNDVMKLEKNIAKYREKLREEQKMLDAWRTDINTRSEERDFREFIRENAPFLNEYTATIIDTLTKEILSERERSILMSMCAGGRLSDVALKHSLCHERTRQIAVKAVNRIGAAMRKVGMLGDEVIRLRVENESLKGQLNVMKMAELEGIEIKGIGQHPKIETLKIPRWMCEGFYRENEIASRLPARLYNSLQFSELKCFYQVVWLERGNFLRLRNFGKKSLTDLELVLEKYNLSLEAHNLAVLLNMNTNDEDCVEIPVEKLESDMLETWKLAGRKDKVVEYLSYMK